MGAADGRCVYAEARWVERSSEAIAVVDGAIEAVDTDDEEGVGIRVWVGSGWGFACTQTLSRAGARGSAAAGARAGRGPAPAGWRGRTRPRATGPGAGPGRARSTRRRLAGGEARRAARGRRGDGGRSANRPPALVVLRAAHGQGVRVDRGGGCRAVVRRVRRGDRGGGGGRRRAPGAHYPSAHGGDVAQAGWEHVRALDLAAARARVAEEAVALLSAPNAGRADDARARRRAARPAGARVGRPLARARPHPRLRGGLRRARASSSATTSGRCARRRGCERHRRRDAPGALGTYGWDDEGVPASSDR